VGFWSNFQVTTQSKKPPIGRKFTQSGHPAFGLKVSTCRPHKSLLSRLLPFLCCASHERTIPCCPHRCLPPDRNSYSLYNSLFSVPEMFFNVLRQRAKKSAGKFELWREIQRLSFARDSCRTFQLFAAQLFVSKLWSLLTRVTRWACEKNRTKYSLTHF
jgi:hypothetical protein